MLNALLTILKYSGLLLATFSSIWGTLHNVTVDLPGGKKRLTNEGRLAIVATIVGLFISLATSLLEDAIAERQAESRRRADQVRTREIILSNHKLHSLNLEWRFDQIPKSLLDNMKEAEKWVSEFPSNNSDLFEALTGDQTAAKMETLERFNKLYPLMSVAAGTGWTTRRSAEVIALVGLDPDGDCVLPFGVSKTFTGSSNFAGGIALSEEYDWSIDPGRETALGHERPSPRSRSVDMSTPTVCRTNSKLTINWELEKSALNSALDYRGDAPLAAFPERIRILLLSKIINLPKTNFAGLKILPWKGELEKTEREANVVMRSTFIIFPNGHEDCPVTFDMRYLGKKTVSEKEVIDEQNYTFKTICDVTVWEGRRFGQWEK